MNTAILFWMAILVACAATGKIGSVYVKYGILPNIKNACIHILAFVICMLISPYPYYMFYVVGISTCIILSSNKKLMA